MGIIRAAFAVATACALWTGPSLAEPKTNMLHQWATARTPRRSPSSARCSPPPAASGSRPRSPATPPTRWPSCAPTSIAGNAPPAVQLKGPEIAEWNETGMTANLDELAAAEGWDKVVAPELLPVMKPTGNWVAAPMNIHRINWLWASHEGLDKAGITELPKTWAEFNADCDKVVAAGLDLHRPCQRRLDRCHDLRGRSSTARTSTSIKKAFVEGDVEAHAQPRHGQGLRADAHDGRQIHGPGHRRPRLRHRAPT